MLSALSRAMLRAGASTLPTTARHSLIPSALNAIRNLGTSAAAGRRTLKQPTHPTRSEALPHPGLRFPPPEQIIDELIRTPAGNNPFLRKNGVYKKIAELLSGLPLTDQTELERLIAPVLANTRISSAAAEVVTTRLADTIRNIYFPK